MEYFIRITKFSTRIGIIRDMATHHLEFKKNYWQLNDE